MRESLKARIEQVFKNHVEKDNGMIVGPDRLLERVLDSVADWLKADEESWRDVEGSDVPEALRDLRTNQLR